MDEQTATKRWVQRQFKTNGVQCQPAALERLIGVVQDVPDPEEFVHSLLEEVLAGLWVRGQHSRLATAAGNDGAVYDAGSDDRKLTPELLDQTLATLEGRAAPKDVIQVVNAAEVPYVVYDPVRRQFHVSAQPRRMLGDAKSKIDMYVNRLQLVLQRLRRNKLFRPADFAELDPARAMAECELTELKAMLGVVGELRTVAGFLTRPEEGRFAIEDLSARVPVDISEAERTHGLFTENSVVVAEGVLQSNGVFKVAALGLPPAEPKADTLKAVQGLDFFGGRPADERGVLDWQAAHPDDRAVFLSDVWLDKPEVLDKLRTILAGYSELEQPPSLFVLAGNFQSYDANAGSTHYGKLRENFTALARCLSHYPALRTKSKFVLVPGPGDLGPGPSLPRPPLPKAIVGDLLEAVPNLVLGSNPCRIRHGLSDIVIFRDNLQHKLRALAALPLAAGDDTPLFEHVCATVLQQAHLSPVPLDYQPVYWELDHALYLYPLPEALVLADSAGAASHSFDTCNCLSPGSLISGTFAAFNPTTREMEICDVSVPEGMEEEEEANDAAEGGAEEEEG